MWICLYSAFARFTVLFKTETRSFLPIGKILSYGCAHVLLLPTVPMEHSGLGLGAVGALLTGL